jgi:hypothetical protein
MGKQKRQNIEIVEVRWSNAFSAARSIEDTSELNALPFTALPMVQCDAMGPTSDARVSWRRRMMALQKLTVLQLQWKTKTSNERPAHEGKCYKRSVRWAARNANRTKL